MTDTVLASYLAPDGRARDLIARAGAAGSTLVIDHDRASARDARLVAHLAADEPSENAMLVSDGYVRDAVHRGPCCRPLAAEDATAVPFSERHAADAPALAEELRDAHGGRFSLELVRGERALAQLRWCRRPSGDSGPGRPVSLRETISSLESYEPAYALTLEAVSKHGGEDVSTTVLRAELARVQASPIILNRRLREAVLDAIERHELSMSEIAIRCGRVKRDRRGNQAGETSWLARRLGLRPEGGHSAPTPWIHSDVLALIARQGLGISPREVEL